MLQLFIKLAWRNLWRNKRRTIITCSSIVFAVILSVLLYSVKDGMFEKMVENSVSFFSGSVQIQEPSFFDDRSLDNSFILDEKTRTTIEQQNEVISAASRIESFGLCASDTRTKVAIVLGIEPEEEDHITALKKRVIEGTYLQKNDKRVMISSGLARLLSVSLNDTIVVLGQGYHGVSAAGKYAVGGIVKLASPELNRQLIYMSLSLAQNLYAMEDRITTIALNLNQVNRSEAVDKALTTQIPDLNVLSWKEIMPDLDQLIKNEDTENVIFLGILYLLISFGIFGTILMMLHERKFEFGVLNAIGLKNSNLAIIVILENIFISLIGAFVGILLSFPIVYYFHTNPIKITGDLASMYEDLGFEPIYYFSMNPSIFFNQTIVVLIISLILSFYPAINLYRLQPVQSMNA